MLGTIGGIITAFILACFLTCLTAGMHYLFKHFWLWRFTDKNVRPFYYTAVGILVMSSCCLIPNSGSSTEQQVAPTSPDTRPEDRAWVMSWYRMPKHGRTSERESFDARIEQLTSTELIFGTSWGNDRTAGHATFRGKRIEKDVYGGTWWQNNPNQEGVWELRRVSPDTFIGWESTSNKETVALYLVAKEGTR